MKKYLILIMVLGLVMVSACTGDTQEDIPVEESSNEIEDTENVDEDQESETREEASDSEGTTDESSNDNNKEMEADESTEDTDETASADESSNSHSEADSESGSDELVTSASNDSNSNPGELEYIDTILISPNYDINDDKVNTAIEKGFPSPITDLPVFRYIPKTSDVIQYVSQDSSFELGESITHTGFHGLEIVYDRQQYSWDDFMGDLDVTESNREVTVSLKGNSIFESDIVDEYEKYYRYFDENEGLYYEVTDLMIGSYTDPDAVLTNTRLGNSCNYNSLDGLVAPSYNPFILQNGEEALTYYITAFNEKPCVFMETIFNDKLYRRWIDIEYGVIVKQLVFDGDGLLVEDKTANSVMVKDIDASVFSKPSDVDFQDITLFIYSFEGGNLEPLVDAVENMPEGDTGIELSYSEGYSVTIYTTGMDDGSLDDVIYLSKYPNAAGEEVTLRELADDRFYTIHDGMEIVEIYDESCFEKKFFNFQDVGLLGVTVEDNMTSYTFYDPNNISVSSLYNVYEYVVEDGEFVAVNFYKVASIADNEPERAIISYDITFIDYDESVYDDSCMDTYEIIDHGEGSIDDGEHMPFWFTEGE